MSFGYVEKGFSPSTEDLKKINKYTRREFDADSLYVFTVILCDNDIDRDFEKFSLSALNELKTFFVGKTGISDHSMKSSDQKARVFETWIEKGNGTTADGEPYYMLKAKAYMLKNEENKGFIDELDAGIKKEVSVSCSSKKATCSICGKDKRQCRCEHVSGKEYKGKIACTILSDISDAYEFSFVAVPAQRQAGVTKAFEFTKENNMEDIIKTLKNMSDDTTVSKFQLDSLLNYVDSLEDEAELGRQRKSGVEKVLGENQITLESGCVKCGNFTLESGYEKAKELFTEHPDVDTLICATDTMAVGAANWLKENGYQIPQQVQIAGMGDSFLGKIIEPKLTTVHFFYKTSGMESAKVLVDLIESKETSSVHKEIKMGCKVVLRESHRNI